MYDVTEAGSIEVHDVPVKEYPEFEAALSFLPALLPDDVVALLNERAQRLEFELAQIGSARELVERQSLPRLFWVEAEFRALLRETELVFVRRLAREIASGALEGVERWREMHECASEAAWPPPSVDYEIK